MSTRSLIALSTDTGVFAAYCYLDGYIEHNGEILHRSYKRREKVADLVMRGDMSCLDDNVVDCKFYNDDYSKTARYESYDQLMAQLGGSIEYIYVFLKNDKWAVVHDKTAESLGVQLLSDEVAKVRRQSMQVV